MSIHIIQNSGRCEQIITRVIVPKNLSYTNEERITFKPIDRCVQDIVKVLVEGGIKTSGSCCGHNEVDGVIVLTDGRILNIMYPCGWYKKNNCNFNGSDKGD